MTDTATAPDYEIVYRVSKTSIDGEHREVDWELFDTLCEAIYFYGEASDDQDGIWSITVTHKWTRKHD